MDENKTEVGTESFIGDVPPIMPDGWQDGDTLFTEEDSSDQAGAAQADELSDDDYLRALLRGEDESEASAPTTDDAKDAGTDAGAKPDGVAPRKLTLKVNHTEQEVDLNAMSDDELRALLQKGYAFDAMKDAEDRRTYLAAYQEQLDAGMTEAAARLVAKDAAGGRAFEVKDGQIVSAPEPEKQPVTPRTAFVRDIRSEVEQLRKLYPDIKEMPDEVARKVAEGTPLVDAYQAYQVKESKKAVESLRKENKILRQNAANAQRAPVRGVTGGGVASQKSDPFVEGFDAGWDWV